MRNVRKFSLIMGIVFTALGVLSFFPGMNAVPSGDSPALTIDTAYSYFMGFLPQNILNKLALLAFGVAGLAIYYAKRSDADRAREARADHLPADVSYARWIFAVFGTLSILGMFEQTSSFFGMMPLWGHYVWVHGLLSLIGGAYGYGYQTHVRRKEIDFGHRNPAYGAP